MVEMFGELLAGLLGLIRRRRLKEASQSLETAYQEFLKEDSSFFKNISKENLADELISKKKYTNSHLEILAGLFYAEAELLHASGKHSECKIFYEKSLILYDLVTAESKTFSLELQLRISQIRDYLNN